MMNHKFSSFSTRILSVVLSAACLLAFVCPVFAQEPIKTPEMDAFNEVIGPDFLALCDGKMTFEEFTAIFLSWKGTKGFMDRYAFQRQLFHDFDRGEYGFEFCLNPAYENEDNVYTPEYFGNDLIDKVEYVTATSMYGINGLNLGCEVLYVTPSAGNSLPLYESLINSDYAIWVIAYPAEGFVSAPPLPGDADNDGAVTAMDARLILRASVGYDEIQPGTRAFTNADLNGDGTLTAAEARDVLRMSVN